MKNTIITLAFLFVSFFAFSQSDSINLQVIELKGKILDASTKQPIVFAHVINMKKGLATISDTSGGFRMIMLKTDSIRISSIGYKIKYFSLPDTVTSTTQYFTIYVSQTTYDLNQIDIYEERWKAFVYDMSKTKIEKDVEQEKIQIWFDHIVSVDELKMLSTAARGIGFPINYKNKRYKQLEIVEELIFQAELNELAEEKYNKELVNRVTGLENKQLDDFMQHIHFDRDFILKQNEYNLIIIIQELYELYTEENK